MPNTRKLQLSFGGGEIDPEMYSRIDSDQNQSGLAKVQNWLVDPKGPLKKRPGFQRVSSSFDSSRKSRLIPFTYSVDQSLVIELSHEKIRFISDGKPVTWANPISFLTSGVNATSNTITFTEPHGLSTDDLIYFSRDLNTSNGSVLSTLPAGLNSYDEWHVTVIDPSTIKVGLTQGEVQSISDQGNTSGGGRLRAFKKSEMPPDHNEALFLYTGISTNNYSHQFTSGGVEATLPDYTTVSFDPDTLVGGAATGIAGTQPLYVDKTLGGAVVFNQENYFGLRTASQLVGTPNLLSGATNTVNANSLQIGSELGQYYKKGELVRLTNDSGVAPNAKGQVVSAKEDFSESIDQTTTSTWATNWQVMAQDGVYEVISPYTEDELFEIEYEQSGDIVTLTHPNHAPRELRRYNDTDWQLVELPFDPTISSPTDVTATVDRGQRYLTADIPLIAGGVRLQGEVSVAAGDTVYIDFEGVTGTFPSSNYYNVAGVEVNGFDNTEITLRYRVLGGVVGSGIAAGGGGSGSVYIASSSFPEEQKYKVTSVDVNLQESLPSEVVTVENILGVPGSSNSLQWNNTENAKAYKVYKELNGVFGFIGSVDNDSGPNTVGVTGFVDDYIGPDMSDTLPLQDEDVSNAYKPRAVANFEQRRCFAGSNNLPRTLFMSRSGTQSSFTYQMPIQASDRVSVQIASREAHTIRHMVGLQDLIILTQQGEWMVTAINSDAIGPETIAIRPQSYIGSNKVRPAVVNNKIVFCANRGGHVRELGFQTQNQGYLTGDLSLRATHLFNGQELTDLAYSKAPTPRLWFVSTSGKLLCLTYVPEEKVLAWQQIVTDGTFESVCAIPEGSFDNVYVVVNRTDSTGATVRSIERMVAVDTEDRSDAVYFDASVSVNGTNTGLRTLEVTSSGLYKSGDVVSVICNEAGVFAESNVGEEIEFTSGTNAYRMRVTVYTSTTQVEAVLLADLPSTLHSTPTTIWAIASKTITGYAHLANQTVSVLADGEMHKDVVVSSLGVLILDRAAVKVCAGLKYTTEAQTLPVSLRMEAGGQGRTKIINKVYLRVRDSSNLSVGSEASDMINVGDLSSTKLSSGEFETKIPDSWDQEGQIVIQSTDGLPSTVLGLTAQISIGD